MVFLYNRPTTADPTPSRFDLGKQMAAASLSTDGTVAFFDETPSDEVTAYLQEKNVEELQAMRDFFKGGGSGLPQDELEEEKEKEEEEAKTAKKVTTYDPDELMTDDESFELVLPNSLPPFLPPGFLTEDENEEDKGDNDKEGGKGNDEEGGKGNDEGEEHHEDHPNQSLPPPPPDHLLPSVSLVALADPKRRLTRSPVTPGKVVTTQSSGSPPFVSRIEENSAGEAAAAKVANNNPKQRKTPTVAAAATAAPRKPKKVPTDDASADSPSLRSSKRTAAIAAKEKISLLSVKKSQK